MDKKITIMVKELSIKEDKIVKDKKEDNKENTKYRIFH